MNDAYRRALAAWDAHRAAVYTAPDATTVRRSVAGLERELLALRRVLFEHEKLDRRRVVLLPLLAEPPRDLFAGVTPFGSGTLIIDGRYVWDGGANTLVRGDVKRSLDALHVVRDRLDRIEDPKHARRVVDRMERLVGVLRRGLWHMEREQRRERRRALRR